MIVPHIVSRHPGGLRESTQSRSDDPTAQPQKIGGEHDQTEVEPVAGPAGDHAEQRAADQRRRQHREPARGFFETPGPRCTTLIQPIARPSSSDAVSQPQSNVTRNAIAYFTRKSMRRFCALPSSVSFDATGCELP